MAQSAAQKDAASACYDNFGFLKAFSNSEKTYLEEAGDHGQERDFWYATECALKDECSSQAWKRAACWSYQSYENCLVYCKNHYMHSGLHRRSAEEAEDLTHQTDIEVETETAEQRQEARDAHAQQPKQKQQVQPKRDPPSSSSHRRQRSRSRSRGTCEDRVQDRVCDTIARVVRKAPAARTPVVTSDGDIRTSFQQAKLLDESLQRLELSSNNSKTLCTALANQFGEEALVAAETRRILRDLVRDAGGGF
eukprot:TRINITY_DN21082_c0_g1_i2.p1 TRINITY_DN21082_c0_g1~~TRINITY_DN21082_c0_g1_i2.p1  ORF type:complete len:278 (-),score=83.77 TRINITY_DN21082_c0_g1_i2:58-810(-)